MNTNKDSQSPGISSYQEAVAYLHSRLLFGVKIDLENMRELCRRLDHPEKKCPAVLVAGTNGKGSTVWYLQKILQARGKRAGLFTSPHFVSFRERIRINGEAISKQELVENVQRVALAAAASESQGLQECEPTFFETLTLVAFLHFARHKLDYAILEVGMGGRLDAVNVCDPLLSIIVSIGLDHTQYLGDTEAKILAEKFGVARSGKPLICGELGHELNQELQRLNESLGAELVFPNANPVSEEIRTLNLPNKGPVYQHNLQLAWTAANYLVPKNDAGEFTKPHSEKQASAKQASARHDSAKQDPAKQSSTNQYPEVQLLQQSPWVGRCQILQHKKTPWVLDGAHNPPAAKALALALNEEFPGKTFELCLSVSSDKDIDGVLKPLLPLAKNIHLMPAQSARLSTVEQMQQKVDTALSSLPAHGFAGEVIVHTSIHTAFDCFESFEDPTVPILITGSLYFLGEWILHLRHHFPQLDFYRQFQSECNEWG